MHGSTSLNIASENGHATAVSALLAAPGVDADGDAPLHSASRRGHAKVVAVLLARRPAVAVNPRNAEGRTPLGVARAAGKPAVAALLEARGGVE